MSKSHTIEKKAIPEQKGGNRFTVSDALDSIKINKFTWSIFFLVGLSMMFDGYDYMIVSYTMPQIAQEWGLDSVAKGSLSSWSMVGLVVGSFLAGPLSDTFGRKKIITLSVFFYGLMTIPVFFAPNFTFFAVMRVIAGVGLGVCTPIVTTLFAEFTPTRYRSFFVTFGMAWMIVGWVVAGVVGTAVVQVASWHWCYLIGGLPAIFAFFLWKFLPESPHWCANKGKTAQAVEVLKLIERRAGRKIDCVLEAGNIIIPPKPKTAGPRAVLSPKYIKITIGFWIVYFAGNFAIYGVNAWLPSLMLERGYEVTSAYALAIAQNAAAVIANCITGVMAEKIGRRRNLLVGFAASLVSIVLAAQVAGAYALVLGVMIFLGFALNYMITAQQPLMAEAYPTEFRNTGVGLTVAVGRIGGIIAPVVLGALLSLNLGYANTFMFLLIPIAIGMLAALLLIKKETKGKTIDDLNEE
ncbi:MAG TPA: MFS transporter [Coriobacteriia bacterium]|nr:MFS transporter [Coriobacteriia bacterium]